MTSTPEDQNWEQTMAHHPNVCQCSKKECLSDLLSADYVCAQPQRQYLREVGVLEEGGNEWPDA